MPLIPMPKRKDDSNETSKLWRYSGMGTELAAAIIGMALLGYLLDLWLGTKPWCTMGGVVVGILGGGYNFLKAALRISREAAEDYKRRHPTGLPAEKRPVEPDSEDPWDKKWDEKWGENAGDGPGSGGGGTGDDRN